MNDYLISLFVLTTILILIKGFKSMDDHKLWPGVLFVIRTGIVRGAGIGLKKTVEIHAIGSAFAFFTQLLE